MVNLCISCKKNIENIRGSTIFPCPKCTNYNIVRCYHCREIAVEYTCPNCGFVGPN